MSSSFPKHFCLHRFFAFFSALLVAGSFFVITKKECRMVILTQEDAKEWYDPSLGQNETLMQLAKENYILRYYDFLQINHAIVIAVCVLLFILGFINISPAQEDIRFGFHLLVIIIMGSITVLSCYSSYQAFHRPCAPNTTKKNAGQPSQGTPIASEKYATYTRLHKDKTPVNAYVEKDNYMMAVAALDVAAAGLILIGTIVLGVDAREEAIQDEYVARVRGPY